MSTNAESKNEILELIDTVSELEKKQNEMRRREFETRDRLNVIRSRHLVEIAQAKDENGKLTFPNERVRQAALTLALDEDPEYQSLVIKLRAMQNELEQVVIEISRLSARKTFLMLASGVLKPPSSDPRLQL